MGTFSDHLLLLCETSLETIRQVIEREHPAVAVIDSIQTMYSEEVTAAPGSVSQVREATKYADADCKGIKYYHIYCRSCD